jgi:hypothetical protein
MSISNNQIEYEIPTMVLGSKEDRTPPPSYSGSSSSLNNTHENHNSDNNNDNNNNDSNNDEHHVGMAETIIYTYPYDNNEEVLPPYSERPQLANNYSPMILYCYGICFIITFSALIAVVMYVLIVS